MRSKMIGLLTIILASLVVSGCTTLAPLAPGETGYVNQKIELALGTDKCVKRTEVLNQNGRHLVITLNVAAETAERDCLKAMRALSRDPSFPQVDDVCVCAEQTQAISFGKQLTGAVVQGAFQGVVQGVTGMNIDPFVPTQTQQAVTTFSCKMTRDALLQGGEPTVIIRNGTRILGADTGQSS